MNREYSIELLRKLSLAFGPSGYEEEVRNLILSELEQLTCDVEVDRIGNIVATFGRSEDAHTVLYSAHQDEIGFIVNDITSDGYLKMWNIGGWSTLTLPSSAIIIRTQSGEDRYGVFGQISPHFLKKGESPSVPALEDLFVDVGAKSKDEAENILGIKVGDVAVPYTDFKYIPETGIVMSKAFDDRVGVAALIDLAREISSRNMLPNNNIKIAFTVQEEVGIRGADVLSRYVNADSCIVVEGAPADDMPSNHSTSQTGVGKGAHVRIFDPTHIASPNLLRKMRQISKENGIVTQEAIRHGGGTDACYLSRACYGMETIVTGVPTRYAHCHNSVISIDDYQELVKLLLASAYGL